MPIFVVLIIFSLVFYLFYKTKYIRSKAPMEKQWLSAKCSIALGLFVFLFGINLFFIHNSIVSTVVAFVFVLLGGASVIAAFKAYKYYLPKTIEERK